MFLFSLFYFLIFWGQMHIAFLIRKKYFKNVPSRVVQCAVPGTSGKVALAQPVSSCVILQKLLSLHNLLNCRTGVIVVIQ